MKSVPNPTPSSSDKVVVKAIAELQSAFKKMQIEQSKQMRLLQNEWKKQVEAITIQNNKSVEILNKIAKNYPDVNAFNDGIKAMQKMNISDEIGKAVSKMNTNLMSEMNKYFNNLNLSSELSSQIEKAVKEYNQSDAMTKPLIDLDWSRQFNEVMEKFNQQWKSYLDNALSLREYNEKKVE
jgi:hypothetical protein